MEKDTIQNKVLFTLDKQQEIKIKELLVADKVNLLLFYNTDCLGCTGRAIPFAYKLMKSHPDKLKLIVIHVDFGRDISNAAILDIFRSKQSPFPIYRDQKAQLYNAVQCEGTPHWLVLNDQGKITHSIFGSQENAQLRLHYLLEEG
jgi:peroxiredoxin